jgi:hypothetical protein
MLAGPWRKPWRMPADADAGHAAEIALLVVAISILLTAALLARRNLWHDRGDRRGAARLAASMALALLLLWVCEVHFVASVGLVATFLVAVCTSIAYGVLVWTIYVALEPYIRRWWPQVLVSSTNVLTGRVRDPVVGRDVLLGVALGVVWVVIVRGADLLGGSHGFASFPGATEVLGGLRGTAGAILEQAPYALRNVLLYFFLLFVIRVLVRRAWAAALVFALLFPTLDVLGGDHDLLSAAITFVYFGSGAFFVLRWGLVAFAVGNFVLAILMDVPATLDAGAWYFPNAMLLVAIPVALAAWGFYTSVSGRRWKSETF